jgi:hypothetical protein
MRKKLATFFIVLFLLTALLTVGFLERASSYSSTTNLSGAGLLLSSIPYGPCVDLCDGGSIGK